MTHASDLPEGVITASVTPMDSNLRVNYSLLTQHIEELFHRGSHGVCLLGTTGEANSLTVEERIEAIEKVIASGINPQKLIIGTGCCAFPDTVKLTKLAASYKVGGILMLPPFYYKNLTENGLFDYFKMVLDQVNDRHLRIYLYNFPKMTGVSFSLDLVKRLISEFPENIVGMKDSSGDWENMELFCREIPGFKLYAGTEKYLLATLRAGGAGCISASTNITGSLADHLYDNWQTSTADDLQTYVSQVRAALEIASFVSGMKYLLSKRYDSDEWLHMRPPNIKLNEEAAKKIETELESLNFPM